MTTDTPKTDLDALIASLGLTYSAEFVPHRLSRNAGQTPKSLNWKISISKPGKPTFYTDFSQGLGHVPRARKTYPAFQRDSENNAAEHGTYYPISANTWQTKRCEPPLLRDVLYSLVLDSDAIDSTFEDWAADYGYDPDSRTAERTYNQCLAIGRQLRALVDGADIQRLREAYQDY